MRKGFILLAFITCTAYFSCKKSPKNNIFTTVTLKITLVSGGGQTDTIGNTLANPIVLEVTANGVPLAGYSVQFKGSGCNQDNTASIITQQGGLTNYTWPLAGDIGQQTLTAYVLNSDNQKVDSIKINATALAGSAGWHNGACSLQGGLLPADFCKLSTGRLFTCFAGGKTSLRYSDDNGASWNAVASLGNSHQIDYVIASSSDEVYAFAADGVFYSNNAGQSWANVGTLPFDPASITAAVVTLNGKIMVTGSAAPPVCISVDKGKSWTAIADSAFPEAQPVFPSFNCPAEDQDGNLYVTDTYNMNIFKSPDAGATWYMTTVGGSALPGINYSFYIDANNIFYESSSYRTNGIYVSDDEGVGYTGYMIVNQKFGNMSLQSDGHFYFEDDSRGLSVFDSYNVGTVIFPFNGTGLQSYIVAKNNNIIVGNWGKPYIRYYSK